MGLGKIIWVFRQDVFQMATWHVDNVGFAAWYGNIVLDSSIVDAIWILGVRTIAGRLSYALSFAVLDNTIIVAQNNLPMSTSAACDSQP